MTANGGVNRGDAEVLANDHDPPVAEEDSEGEDEEAEEPDELGEGGEDGTAPATTAITERTKKALSKLQVRQDLPR